MGYYATHHLFAIWDPLRMKVLKKRDVTFFEHILRHPAMAQFGMTPGHNILGEVMEVTDGEMIELALDDGDEVQIRNGELHEVHALLMTLETIESVKDTFTTADEIHERDPIKGEANYTEMPFISMLSARSFGYHKNLQTKQQIPTQIPPKKIQEQYDERYL